MARTLAWKINVAPRMAVEKTGPGKLATLMKLCFRVPRIKKNSKDPWDWYIYTYIWLIFKVNVGKHIIHGTYGLSKTVKKH